MSRLRELFEAELAAHGLKWCRGCDKGSHKRGFATPKDRIVHFEREIGTRGSLNVGLHEIAHCVLNHVGRLRRYEEELQANEWASRRMRELGVSVPRKVTRQDREYEGRMKRRGYNMSRWRKALQRKEGTEEGETMKTMSAKQRSLVARRALLDYLKTVRALDALQKTMPLVDGEPYAPLAGLGIGVRQISGAIEQMQKAVGLNRRAAECLDRLGRVLRPGETVLGVLQGDE